MDGVLVDAVKLHQRAFIEALRPYKEITEEYHMQHLNGIPTKKKLEKLNFNIEMVEEINRAKQDITFDLIPKLIRPIREVTLVIEEIKRRNIPFAVCSNSIRKTIELFLEQVQIDGFNFIISNQEVINPKPDPEMYNRAIERLGLNKSEVLIVEDSPVGLEAATASGARVCKVDNPQDINKVIEALNILNNVK